MRENPLVPAELLSRIVDYFHPRRIVLFGSRAGGNARPDPDWDIAVFLKEPMETEAEALRLADAGIDILLDTGAVINSVRLPAGSWDKRTGFMREIRREGIVL